LLKGATVVHWPADQRMIEVCRSFTMKNGQIDTRFLLAVSRSGGSRQFCNGSVRLP